MLIMPPEQTGAARVSRRERWMIGGVLGSVVALAIALVISFSSGGPSSGHGCIYATIPGAVGAVQVHECGATARATCRSVDAAYPPEAARTVAAACRKAGLPVGS